MGWLSWKQTGSQEGNRVNRMHSVLQAPLWDGLVANKLLSVAASVRNYCF